MEFADLMKIRGLVQHRYVIGAVICLGERPLGRYSELGRAITSWTGDRIGDGEITRTVHRLQVSGLVNEKSMNGKRVLELTPEGKLRLQTLRALSEALRLGDLTGRSDEKADASQPAKRARAR